MTETVETKPLSLISKLAAVMGAVERVAKHGRNDFHKYDYATEADIVSAVRAEMAHNRLMLVPSVESTTWRTVKEGSAPIVALNVRFTIHDGDSDEKLWFNIIGEGQDTGDKATYKAMTGATKYALLKLFLIPTGDDPERDNGAGSGNTDALKPKRKGETGKPAVIEAPSSQLIQETRDLFRSLKLTADYGKRLMEAHTGGQPLDKASKAQVESLRAVLMKMKDKSPPASPEVIPAHRTTKVIDPQTGEVHMTAGITVLQLASIRENMGPADKSRWLPILMGVVESGDWRDLTEEAAETYAGLLIEALK